MSAPQSIKLQRLTPSDIKSRQYNDTIESTTLQQAQTILDQVKTGGVEALKHVSFKLGDIESIDTPLIIQYNELKKSYDSLDQSIQQLLQRTADRIYMFASKQKQSIVDMSTNVLGGTAGHTVVPVDTAGCYAPAGRYPLPSSIMMTACTARAAGVKHVIVASPKATELTRAAAYISGANELLCIGGAQAIGAMAYGIGVHSCDVICGPGNKWVTAAKKIVSGVCGIDMLAGPSELLVIADHTSNPVTVAADLLAQAEHDTEARPILITTDMKLIERVEYELTQQLSTFPSPNRETATSACSNGFAVLCDSIEQCIKISNIIAPEHLEVLCDNSAAVGKQLSATGTYGGLFIGSNAAEVLGDYGCGPNHTLPTMATARYTGGLSVFNFLRIRTWLQIDSLHDAQQLVNDSIQLARLEGLEGHARSAERRLLVTSINSTNNISNTNGLSEHKYNDRLPNDSNSTTRTSLHDTPSKTITKSSDVLSPQPKALQYIRSDFNNLMEYSPVKPLDVLAGEIGLPVEQLAKLNANENLYGPLDQIRTAVQNSVMHIYPDPDQNQLRDELARTHSMNGMTKSNIVAGAGSDELLDLLFTLTQCKSIVTLPPTFSMYEFFARLHSTQIIEIPRGNASTNWSIDMNAVITATNQQNASIVFIASPNNPTGNIISNTDVATLCEQCNALIVIDEAYAEFSTSSAVDLINQYSNLIVVRTFSKWAGLAGLRIGYMLAHESIVLKVMQIKQPYNINVAADQAAICALQNRQLILDTAVQAMRYEKQRLLVQLDQFEWLHPLPSEANFVLCELTENAVNEFGGTPRTLQKQLFNAGVLVRCYAGNSDSTLNNQIRISCGRPNDTDRLIEVLCGIQDKYQLATNHSVGHQLHRLLISSHSSRIPSAVLFDMDGVLADVSQSYRTAIIQTCAAFGVHITNRHITEYKNHGNANNDWLVTYNLIQQHHRSSPPPPNITYEQVKSKFQQLYLGTNNTPGLRDNERLLIDVELLKQLSGVSKLAVVTGRPHDDCIYFLKLHHIDSYFTVISTMDDSNRMKPDAEPILYALKQLKLDLTQLQYMYMIGDTIDDINSVHNANKLIPSNTTIIPLGIVAPGDTDIDHSVHVLYQSGASRVLHTLEQLRELVLLQQYNIYRPEHSIDTVKHNNITDNNNNIISKSLRTAEHTRTTSETICTASVNLDGTGKSTIHTGIGFLDHMITALSKHSRIDIQLQCTGDLYIDDHHTTEDCGITLGTCIARALGNKQGIYRYGSAYAPLDESLVRAVVDFSGRSSHHVHLQLKRDMIGTVSSEMLEHFMHSLADSCQMTLHVDTITGSNDHHKAEAGFKALALAMRRAVAIDNENKYDIPSTKDAL